MTQIPTPAWICTVCGYIHYGSEPPEECPSCGAPRELFDPYVPPSVPQTVPKQWRCTNCGYIHDDPQPPSECPVCGAPAEQFEPYTAEAVSQPAGAAQKVAIIGAGIAGVSAAEAIRKLNPQAEINLISSEASLPYYRLNLTRYLAGEIDAEQLTLHPETWYTDQGIQLSVSSEVSSVDLARKELGIRGKDWLAFDKLILAVGSRPFVPPFSGVERKNVTTLRTRGDADFILEVCRSKGACVCIGGGLLGLETAGALARQGVQVTVVESLAWLLPRQLNKKASQILQSHVWSLGIALHTDVQTRELAGDEAVQSVLLSDATVLPAGLVVVSAGIRSNVSLAQQAGLDTKGGILVNDAMQTSHPEVFAAGDAAEHRGIVYGIWGPSQIQGSVAGMNAAGHKVEFKGVPRSNTLKVLDIDLFSIGRITPEAADQMIEVEAEGKYYCFIFSDNRLVGSILLGDLTFSMSIKKVIESQYDFTSVLRKKPDCKDILLFLHESNI